MSYRISAEQVKRFEADGFLILRDVLSDAETREVQQWAQEVHDWLVTEDSKTERYVDCHPGFDRLLRGEKLLSILGQLSGQSMRLFKEKINYKLAGSGGFAAHIDAPAYTAIKDIKHLTILLAVDPANTTNGGLEAVKGSHKMRVPLNNELVIEPSWSQEQEWTPIELGPGELLAFGSYLAHRSGANHSKMDRKALYATYNRENEGDLREEYYKHRAMQWPATHLRKADVDYSEGQLRYGFGSPMLSIVAGKQVDFGAKPVGVKT